MSEVFQQWKYCTETHLKEQVAGKVGQGTSHRELGK